MEDEGSDAKSAYLTGVDRLLRTRESLRLFVIGWVRNYAHADLVMAGCANCLLADSVFAAAASSVSPPNSTKSHVSLDGRRSTPSGSFHLRRSFSTTCLWTPSMASGCRHWLGMISSKKHIGVAHHDPGTMPRVRKRESVISQHDQGYPQEIWMQLIPNE